MTAAPRLTHRWLLFALAAIGLSLIVMIVPVQAHATYGALGQLGAGKLKWGEEGKLGEVEGLETHDLAVDPTTGNFFIADLFEEGNHSYGRVQEFDPTGEPLAESRVLLGEVKGKQPEVEGLRLAVDGEEHRVYLLVADNRVKGLRSFDDEIEAAAELWEFSTEVESKKLKGTPTLLDGQSALEPMSTEHKTPLIYPSGIAVESSTHDVLILAQQEEGTEPKGEEEELVTVVQRVHTKNQNELGPRYIDSANCLDSGENFKEGEECAKRGGSGEYPTSMVVTPEGKLYVDDTGVAGEIWEVPAAEQQAKTFATAKAAVASSEEVSTTPKRLFTLGKEERHNGEFKNPWPELEFASNEEKGGSMSFVSKGPGEGTFYVLANIAQGEGEGEKRRAGIALIDYTGGSHAQEQGWTAAGPQAPPTNCTIKSAASGGQIRLAGLPNGDVLALDGDTIQEETLETYTEVLEFGSGGTGCDKPNVTSPRVEVGENSNASEIEAGKAASVLSTLHGGDALSTEWKFKYKTTSGEVGEEKAEAGFQHRQPAVAHTFQHAGTYEIVETVDTDCLGEPTIVTTRTGFVVKGAKAPTITRDPTSVKVAEGAGATFEAAASGATSVQWQVKKAGGTFEADTADPGNTSGKLTVEHTTLSESGYEYRAVFKNGSSEASTTSAILTVEVVSPPPPPPPPPPGGGGPSTQTQTQTTPTETPKGNPEVKIAGVSIVVTPAGAFGLKLTCPSGDPGCVGTVTLRTTGPVSVPGKKKKSVVTLASGSFDVAGGAMKVVTLHLSAQARTLLTHSHALHAQAMLVAHDSTGATHSGSVAITLQLAKLAKSHKH